MSNAIRCEFSKRTTKLCANIVGDWISCASNMICWLIRFAASIFCPCKWGPLSNTRILCRILSSTELENCIRFLCQKPIILRYTIRVSHSFRFSGVHRNSAMPKIASRKFHFNYESHWNKMDPSHMVYTSSIWRLGNVAKFGASEFLRKSHFRND